MYRIDVFHPGAVAPTESLSLSRAADALEAIPSLLARHLECERIVVTHQGQRLFAVDCQGQRI